MPIPDPLLNSSPIAGSGVSAKLWPQHLAKLRQSALSDQQIAATGYWTDGAGHLQIPYLSPDGKPQTCRNGRPFLRFRLTDAEIAANPEGASTDPPRATAAASFIPASRSTSAVTRIGWRTSMFRCESPKESSRLIPPPSTTPSGSLSGSGALIPGRTATTAAWNPGRSLSFRKSP